MRHKSSVKLVIIHDYSEALGECWPGEEVIAIILIHLGRWYWIPLSPTHLIVADFLCRNRSIGLDAWQITAKLQSDPFVLQHATNAPGGQVRPARTSRTAVRQQIKRIRGVLADLIAEEGLDLKAEDIIQSEETSTRVVRYRVNAEVRWRHCPRSHGENFVVDLEIPDCPPILLGSARPNQFEIQ